MPFFTDIELRFLGHEFLLPPINQNYDIEHHAIAIMCNAIGDDNVFCGMISFYISLQQQYPFSTIEISKICCWHKMYIHAFKLGYTIREPNGNIFTVDSDLEVLKKTNAEGGAMHFFQETQEELDRGEYIVDARQEGMLERIVFMTNRRVISFGINSGIDATGSISKSKSRVVTEEDHRKLKRGRKIVALGGSCYKGRKLKLAFFTESVNWSIIGHFILLRRLSEDERANVKSVEETSSIEIHLLAKYLIDESSQEIFRIILSCLAFDIPS